MSCCSPQRKHLQRLLRVLRPKVDATTSPWSVCNCLQYCQTRTDQEISGAQRESWLTLVDSHVCWISQVSGTTRMTDHASSLAPGTCPAYPGLAHLHNQISKKNSGQLLTGNLSNRNTSRQSQSLACSIMFPLVSWLPPASSSLRWQWHHLAPFEVLTQHSQCDHQCGSWINEVCRTPTCCCLTKDNNSTHI